jgi:hypothetical protein
MAQDRNLMKVSHIEFLEISTVVMMLIVGDRLTGRQTERHDF